MEFITVERFKEQPIEVQKVLLDWWKCEPFDIYAWCWNLKDNKWSNESCCNQIQADTINKSKEIDYIIPLFIEGQLRKFIEDKEHCLLDIRVEDLNDDYNYYTIIGWEIKELEYGREFGEILFEDCIGAEDLLQLYWKIACSIAKEFVDEDRL